MHDVYMRREGEREEKFFFGKKVKTLKIFPPGKKMKEKQRAEFRRLEVAPCWIYTRGDMRRWERDERNVFFSGSWNSSIAHLKCEQETPSPRKRLGTLCLGQRLIKETKTEIAESRWNSSAPRCAEKAHTKLFLNWRRQQYKHGKKEKSLTLWGVSAPKGTFGSIFSLATMQNKAQIKLSSSSFFS